jgi:hypothetical protein
MTKLFYGICTLSIAAGLVFAAPIVQRPLFGTEPAPGKIEQGKAGKQIPASKDTPVKTMTRQAPKTKGGAVTGTNADTVKNKAKDETKKTRIDEDPVGTRK